MDTKASFEKVENIEQPHWLRALFFWLMLGGAILFVCMDLSVLIPQVLSTRVSLLVDDYLVTLLYLIIIFTSLIVIRIAPNIFNPFNLSIPGFAYWTFFLYVTLPGIKFFSELDRSKVAYIFLISTHMTLPLLAFGIVLGDVIWGNIDLRYKKFIKSPFVNNFNDEKVFGLFTLLVFASTLLVGLYMLVSPSIPLFDLLLQRPGVNFSLAREYSFKLLPKGMYAIFEILRSLILPILAMISLSVFKLPKKSRFLKVCAFYSIGLSFFFAALSIAKAPPLILLTQLLMFIYLAQGCRIPFRYVLVAPIALLAFPMCISLLTSSAEHLELMDVYLTFKDIIFRRILFLPSKVLYFYIDAFPEHLDYLNGTSIRMFSYLAGLEDLKLPNFIYHHMKHDNLSSGWANAAFIGAAWADFGWLGLVSYPIVAGMILQGLQYVVLSFEKGVIALALQVVFLIFAGMLANNSLTGTLYLILLPTAVAIGVTTKMGWWAKLGQGLTFWRGKDDG